MTRVGITQRVEYLADRNERRDCLDQQWTKLLLEHRMIPVPMPNHVEEAELYIDELRLDAIILSGGNDLSSLPDATNTAPERDAFERRLLALARERAIPLFGVCRGMQMMVVDSGGELVRIEGHVARPHQLEDRCGKMLFAGRALVNSFHGFGVQVRGLGAEWNALATAPDGTVEAIAHRQYPQAAVMWHPERSPQDPGDIRLIKKLFTRGTPLFASGGER